MPGKVILLTGAAGAAARMLRPLMHADYRLRLFDREPVPDRCEGEESVTGDLADLEAVTNAVEGVDGIVHLGAYSVEGPWELILGSNIVGTYNVFEAARLADVKRVVFASSNHAVGFYRREHKIGVDVTVRPDSRYGLSKCFGEALGSLYADKYGAEVLCIRIGNVEHKPLDVRRLAIWISPRDLCQLIRLGLEHPALRYEIVYGMSDNARAWWDNANALRLGYRPQDRAEDHAAEVLAAHPEKSGDDLVDDCQGGSFVRVESGGDPWKL
jgi:uronate dehydrogenase